VQERERLQEELTHLKAVAAANGGALPLGEGISSSSSSRGAGEPGGNHETSELLDEIASLEEQVARLEDDVGVLTGQLMAKTQEKSRLEAEKKALEVAHEELEQLLEEIQEQQGGGRQLEQENNSSADSLDGSGGGSPRDGMVSTLLLQEFQEQHLEERAEWDAERSRLEADIAELREWKVSHEGGLAPQPGQQPPALPSRAKGEKEPLAPADWHLVQAGDHDCENS